MIFHRRGVMIPICKSHHVLHEGPELLGDNCKLLEGSANIVLLVLPLHRRVPHLVQRLRHLHLQVGMVWKEFSWNSYWKEYWSDDKDDDTFDDNSSVAVNKVTWCEANRCDTSVPMQKQKAASKKCEECCKGGQIMTIKLGTCHTSVSLSRDKPWEILGMQKGKKSCNAETKHLTSTRQTEA